MEENITDFDKYKRSMNSSTKPLSAEDEKRVIYRRGYKKGANKGYLMGLKRGLVAGALATLVAVGAIGLGGNAVKNAWENVTATNSSVEYGYDAVRDGTYPAQEPGTYWYNYSEIADAYNEDIDFDSFIYGATKKIGWNEASTIKCMDELFRALNRDGITDHHSFVSYCKARGACKEVDGEIVVDMSKYRELAAEYINMLDEMQEQEEKVSGFRRG